MDSSDFISAISIFNFIIKIFIVAHSQMNPAKHFESEMCTQAIAIDLRNEFFFFTTPNGPQNFIDFMREIMNL